MSTTEKGIVSDIARGADWLDDGNNNFTRLRRMVDQQWGPRPAAFSGITYAWFGGTAWDGSAWTEVADGTTALTDNTDNYVERTVAGVVSTNTTGFTASKLPMAVVTTASAAITAIEERRMPTVPSSVASYSDEAAQDAVGAMVDASLVYVDATPLLTRAALTGDVTASQGSNATTIANDAVTFAKIQNIATARVLGRSTASSGDIEELTIGSGLSLTGGVLDTSGSSGIAATIFDAKGDIIAASAADTAARLAVGANGKMLMAASGESTGLKWDYPTESLIIACSDETTAVTTGTAKVTFRMPYAFTLSAVRASVTTAPTGATLTIDINESGTTILSTKLTIDASEKTSTTAATAAVISDSALADDAEMTIDFDQVGSTIAGAGVKVYLIGTRA